MKGRQCRDGVARQASGHATGWERGRQAGRLGRVLARRLANGKLLGPQSPVTLEKSDFSCAKTGWLGWMAGWLMMGRELRKLSNQGLHSRAGSRPSVAPFLDVENGKE